MRAVQSQKWGYIYNGWANGKAVFRNESQAVRAWKDMVESGKTEPVVQARVNLFSKGVVEELFYFENDPGGL